MCVVGFIVLFLFTCIYSRGYEGKGIMEGARFGLIIGLYTGLRMAFATYMMIAIPESLAVECFVVFSLAEMIVAGIVVAAIYKPALPAAAR